MNPRLYICDHQLLLACILIQLFRFFPHRVGVPDTLYRRHCMHLV